MIRIVKPAIPPPALNQGLVKNLENCAAFDKNPLAYIDGSAAFEIDKKIYGNKSVKQILKTIQHKKCCYCEGIFEAAAYGDVEHFRPKGGAVQDVGHKPDLPGYYWLGYAWENLYFSCEICNRSYKRNFFPLGNPAGRARFHDDDLASESPLLIDPGGPEDPRVHIEFHDEVPYGVTLRGKQTVKTLKLDREELNSARRARVNQLALWRDLIDAFNKNPDPGFASLADRIQRNLDDAGKPEAIYSAMAQDFLK